MLKRLYISNYALIDHLEIELKDGLTIITGETGAGKSILLGALSLLLGERAESKVINDSSKKTIVEGVFDITGYDLRASFESNDVDFDQNECIIRREINQAGRSRAFINDMPVSVSVLKEICSLLVDIHSQHSNTLICKNDYQLSVLDNIAVDKPLLNEYQKIFRQYKDTAHRLGTLEENLKKSRQEEDYIRFQLSQLSDAALVENEDIDLENKQRLLANASEIKQSLWQVVNVIDGEGDSVLQRLGDVSQLLKKTAVNMQELDGMAERVESALIDLKDISQSASYLGDGLDDNPQALQDVEDRLGIIYDLERKHGVDSVNELLLLQRKLEAQIALIDTNEDELNLLRSAVVELKDKAAAAAGKVTEKRKAAAKKLEAELKRLCLVLGLKNLDFEVCFETVALNPSGQDCVEFKVSFNKNHPLQAVKDVASGGELSRMMLVIKSIIAGVMNLPTIIFDEVDTGVSGDIASLVGEMMKDISGHIQVIAITHLPQVAAMARQHMLVFKTETAKGATTGIRMLDAEEHVMEIARLLSGRKINDAAIENARILVNAEK